MADIIQNGRKYLGWADTDSAPAFPDIRQGGQTFAMPNRNVVITAQWAGAETDFQFEVSANKSHSFIVGGTVGDKFDVNIGYNPVTGGSGTITSYTFSTSEITVTIPSSSSARVVRFYDYGSEIKKLKPIITDIKDQWDRLINRTSSAEITKVIKLKSLINIDISALFCGQRALTSSNYLNGLNGAESVPELELVSNFDIFFQFSNIDKLTLNMFKNCFAAHRFQSAFQYCSLLTEIETTNIPRAAGLKGNVSVFDDCEYGTWFEWTFANSPLLTEYPPYLFQKQLLLAKDLLTAGCFSTSGLVKANPLYGVKQSTVGQVSVWNLFENSGNLEDIDENLFDGAAFAIYGGSSAGIANTFEQCRKIKEYPMRLLHGAKNLTNFRAAFNHSNIAKFHYNQFWACPKDIETMANAFSNCTSMEMPECFFRVMKRDGAGNYIKPLDLPYYNLTSNVRWDANGKGTGQPSGNFVTPADLEPMNFRYPDSSTIPGVAGNTHKTGFEITFYRTHFQAIPICYDGISCHNLVEMFFEGGFHNLLGQASIAASVKWITNMARQAHVGMDIASIFSQASYPNLEKVNSAFSNCSGLTGAAIPIIQNINKLGRPAITGNVDNHKGCFAGCVGLSDYAQLVANYPNWVINEHYSGASFIHKAWDDNRLPKYRFVNGYGYLRGVPRGFDNFFTYLENVPNMQVGDTNGSIPGTWSYIVREDWGSSNTSAFCGWGPGYGGSPAPSLATVQAKMQGIFGSAWKGTYATYADMILNHPLASDTHYGEILF